MPTSTRLAPAPDFIGISIGITEGNTTYGHATDIDLFPTYAEAIDEDWNAIFGLRAKPVSAQS